MCLKKLIRRGLVIIIFFVFSSYAANISIVPNESIVRNGSVVQLDIVVSDLGQEILSGFDIGIIYDPLVFELVNYQITDALGNMGDGSVLDLSTCNKNEGILNLVALSLVYDIPPQSDPLIISNVNMKVIKGEKVSKFDIVNPILINYYGEMVPIGNIYGAVVSTVPEPLILYFLPFVFMIGVVVTNNILRRIV